MPRRVSWATRHRKSPRAGLQVTLAMSQTSSSCSVFAPLPRDLRACGVTNGSHVERFYPENDTVSAACLGGFSQSGNLGILNAVEFMPPSLSITNVSVVPAMPWHSCTPRSSSGLRPPSTICSKGAWVQPRRPTMRDHRSTGNAIPEPSHLGARMHALKGAVRACASVGWPTHRAPKRRMRYVRPAHDPFSPPI